MCLMFSAVDVVLGGKAALICGNKDTGFEEYAHAQLVNQIGWDQTHNP